MKLTLGINLSGQTADLIMFCFVRNDIKIVNLQSNMFFSTQQADECIIE
jgi:hypothetical protein